MAKPAGKKPSHPKTPDRVRKRRYATLRGGKGQSRRTALHGAGYRYKNARTAATAAYKLEKDPFVQQVMQDEMAKSMSAAEVTNLLGAMARGEVPTKVTRGKKSYRVESDTHAAAESVAKIHQLFKDGAPPPPAGPARTELSVAGMSDEELAKIVRGAAESLGVKAGA